MTIAGPTPGGLLQLGLAAVLLLVIALAEASRPFAPRGRESPARLLTNFGLGFVNVVLGWVLPVSSISAAIWARDAHIGIMSGWPDMAAAPGTFVLASLAAYWFHRASHSLAPMWRIHRVHHSDTAVDLSTGFRHHPLELVLLIALLVATTVALGLHPAGLFAYQLTTFCFTMWSHANWSLPRLLEARLSLLVVTPAMHRLHHSVERAETDSNFGEVLSVWDRVFGTFRRAEPERLRTMPLGLGPDFDARASSILGQAWLPFEGH